MAVLRLISGTDNESVEDELHDQAYKSRHLLGIVFVDYRFRISRTDVGGQTGQMTRSLGNISGDSINLRTWL